MTRLEANIEILERLFEVVEKNPQLRFGEVLRNLGIVRELRLPMVSYPLWTNEFNTESTATLA